MTFSTILNATAVCSSAVFSVAPSIFIKHPLQSGSLANVHLNYGSKPTNGEISLSFGDCESGKVVYDIVQMNINQALRPEKFVWYLPEDAHTTSGCLFAKHHASDDVFAKSERYTPTKKRETRLFGGLTHLHFDAARYHHNNGTHNHSHATAKNAKIGIVGAGISGLFSAFLLNQAGFHNYDILEASERVGGRIRTVHFDDSKKNYVEMGAMRIPFQLEFEGKSFTYSDHNIVYQFAEELNSLNGNDSHHLEFIEWWGERENNLCYKQGFRLPDGRIPTYQEVEANPNLIPSDVSLEALSKEADQAENEYLNAEWYHLMSANFYDAFEKAIKLGYDDWSQWSWLHNKMGISLNATEARISDRISSIWTDLSAYFSHLATTYKTFKGGFDRFPSAFLPLIGQKIRYNTKVSKLVFINNKVSVQWKKQVYGEHISTEYDNVIVSAPFGVVNSWILPQEMNYNIKSAIKNMIYGPSCKVALEFSSRFWEKYDRPIKGGCDVTDLMSENICYPNNDIGSNGPGTVLASYTFLKKNAYPFTSMTEEDHIDRVLEDFTQLHGDLVKKYYTGKYSRVCWLSEPHQAGAWPLDAPGQQTLYLPSYFKVDHGIVFVGEHTDINHGWISAALQSAIRGVAMVLIDNGHIDEAKEIIHKYKATWLNI